MSSTDERKYWGFLLFQQVYGTASPGYLPALFSRNFTRCLGNQLASQDRYLHRAAEKTIKLVLDRAESEPTAAHAALRGLISSSDANMSFGQLTKTMEKLIGLTDDASLSRLFNELYAKLVRPGVMDEKNATSRRQAIIDQFACFLKSRQNTDTTRRQPTEDLNRLATQILEVFVKFSYFSIEAAHRDSDHAPVPRISEKTREMMKTRLSSCLSHIMSRYPNPTFFAYKVVDSIRFHESVKSLHSVLELTGTMRKSMANAWDMLDQVHKRATIEGEDEDDESDDRTFLDAFEFLCSLAILQVYNGDPDAVSILDELQSFYDLSRNKTYQQGSEVLIEVLLSFIAKPSQLFRRLAQQVFSVFAPQISPEGLQSMIKVCSPVLR